MAICVLVFIYLEDYIKYFYSLQSFQFVVDMFSSLNITVANRPFKIFKHLKIYL